MEKGITFNWMPSLTLKLRMGISTCATAWEQLRGSFMRPFRPPGRLLLHAVGGCVSFAGLTEIAREASADEFRASPKAKKLPAELLRVNAQNPEPEVLRYAADFLTRGSVVAIPTDTLYGLAADPFNLAAVDEIYRVKGRPEARALPILINSMDQAVLLARDIPRNFVRLAEALWPGALTLVVDASHRLPLKVTANTRRIALRWPNSGVVNRLIDEFDG